MEIKCPLAMLLLLCLGTAAPAVACSYLGHEPHEIDPAEQGVDTEPPGQAEVLELFVEREEKSLCPGFIYLLMTPAEDDRTNPESIGYFLAVVDGNRPGNLTFAGHSSINEPVLIIPDQDPPGQAGLLMTLENDDVRSPVDFTVTVTAVDLAGNRGPASEPFRIFDRVDTGGGCGCDAAARDGDANYLFSMLLALAVVAFRVRRR